LKPKKVTVINIEVDFRSQNYWIEIDGQFAASTFINKTASIYPFIAIYYKGTKVSVKAIKK
jgi:hypothetical protein